ncbi:Ankyrin repeats (3 copies) [compost metagenome]
MELSMNAKKTHLLARGVLTAFAATVICIPEFGAAAAAQSATQAARPVVGQVSTENGVRLAEAAKNNDIKVVRALLTRGANIDEGADGDGTALIAAARLGNLNMVNALLQMGATVEKCWSGDGNALIAAAIKGHTEVVARLLQAGAQVDIICPYDETALINASRAGHLAVVRQLVEHGANVNLGTQADSKRWRTPLNQARDPKIRDFLLGKGARS